MTQAELLVLIALFLIVTPVVLLIWVVWWLNKNNISIQESTQVEGAYLSSGGRYRVVKGKLYPIRVLWAAFSDNYLYYDKITETKEVKIPPTSLFGGAIRFGKEKVVKRKKTYKKPVLVEDVQDYFLVTEGMPLIGCKMSLKLKRVGSKLIPWRPNIDLNDKGITTNTRMVKINDLRHQLYESTKLPMTTQDILLKVALPMGLIMLAIILVIFFPKMYNAVTQGSKAAFEGSKEAVWNWLGQNPPKG